MHTILPSLITNFHKFWLNLFKTSSNSNNVFRILRKIIYLLFEEISFYTFYLILYYTRISLKIPKWLNVGCDILKVF